MKRLTEEQVLRSLRRLDKGWPDGLTLFSWSGTLCLMRTADMPDKEGESHNPAIIETFNQITSDGGDPD